MSAASIPSVLCMREGGKERRERRRKGRKERDGEREGGRLLVVLLMIFITCHTTINFNGKSSTSFAYK
jgi:hypothetical protein